MICEDFCVSSVGVGLNVVWVGSFVGLWGGSVVADGVGVGVDVSSGLYVGVGLRVGTGVGSVGFPLGVGRGFELIIMTGFEGPTVVPKLKPSLGLTVNVQLSPSTVKFDGNVDPVVTKPLFLYHETILSSSACPSASKYV